MSILISTVSTATWVSGYGLAFLIIVSPIILSMYTSLGKSGDAWPMIFMPLASFVGWSLIIVLLLAQLTALGTIWWRGELNSSLLISHLLVIVSVLVVVCTAYWYVLKPAYDLTDTEQHGPDGFPIIFWTIESGDMDGVKKILENGGDIDAKGYASETPALMAAKGDQWTVALYLLEEGADIRVVSKTGMNIPARAKDSRVTATSEEGIAKEKVWQMVEEAGIAHWADYTGPETRAMVEEGTWPPAKPATH